MLSVAHLVLINQNSIPREKGINNELVMVLPGKVKSTLIACKLPVFNVQITFMY